MQRDLLPRSDFSITPESRREQPRLWVRRLVIWREPGAVIRSIGLKPGLNIVWSPDPRASDAPIGHGGGKTMFCRFLRYCLGEDSFAPEGQRLSIWNRFPDGHVGAEIILDGQLWVVVRALGTNRKDKVIRGGSLDHAMQDEVAPTGIDLVREAISQAILGDAAKLMPSAIGEAAAWEAALAWVTRDQECRFAHHLEWRDPNTDSRSPVRGRSREDRLAVVRALIGALTTDEMALQSQEGDEEKQEKLLQAKLTQLDPQIERARLELARELDPEQKAPARLPLVAAHFSAAAAERLAAALKLPPASRIIDLHSARAAREQTANELRQLEAKLAEIAVRIEEKGKVLAYMRADLPEARARLTREGNPICPICEVPIDRALAEACGISTATCDLNALQVRIAHLRANIEREQNEIRLLRGQEPKLQAEIALLQQRLKPLDDAVTRLEQGLLDQSAAIRTARRLVDDVERYRLLLSERDTLAEALGPTRSRLESMRARLGAHRAAAAEAIRRLSTGFDGVMRELIPGDIAGDAKLDGNGLSLKVELGGERITVAFESLKVVAFDLAALAMTIEGRTRLPGFLVHDSPREADLGESIYSRVFEFVRKLEGYGPKPLFQYIITTTTEPPEKLRGSQWTRLVLRGAPAEERLLKVDL